AEPTEPGPVDGIELPPGADGAYRPSSAVVSFSAQEIASVMLVLARDEVALGELARARAVSAEVRRFAESMIDDHTRAAERLASIVRSAEPERDPTARVLARLGELVRLDLAAVSTEGVDITYMTA